MLKQTSMFLSKGFYNLDEEMGGVRAERDRVELLMKVATDPEERSKLVELRDKITGTLDRMRMITDYLATEEHVEPDWVKV